MMEIYSSPNLYSVLIFFFFGNFLKFRHKSEMVLPDLWQVLAADLTRPHVLTAFCPSPQAATLIDLKAVILLKYSKV
jgi:hypothetical protein